MFRDPVEAVEIMKKNYGFAGRQFVEMLQDEENMQHAVAVQKSFYRALSAGEATEKQAMAASVILAADALIDEWIFKDGKLLKFDDIVPYLSTKKQVSANERALEFLYDYISINQNRFDVNYCLDHASELWGTFSGNYTCVIQTKFNQIMRDEGYNPAAFLSWAKRRGIIETDGSHNARVKRINGHLCRCIFLKNQDCNIDFDVAENVNNPFINN